MSQHKPTCRRIFIADDDSDDLDMYREIIAGIPDNYAVCFDDGKFLFDYLFKMHANDLPDLVILDLNMPRWNGLRTVEAIRKIDRLKQIPIVVITTSKNELDKLQCKRLDIPMYTKASSFSSLKELLYSILTGENKIVAEKI